ncbi:SDR family oxidoreductase [Shewanella sp. OMA3-2]|uniref:SDR family oxidoreductase n=1 Tax=Shewanella sp. OMA3-2 TaxID=2908650 RepID=UPI001F231E8B|nr:SDR family oxidoreductase [Shewanella sp. OMA3-2]UJF20379.1 SDR family oxidoreductase [Shewanella sp. OMA3-2]
MASITIIGCGWFGFPLAQSLITQGHQVKANKRKQSDLIALSQAGIAAYQLDLSAEIDLTSTSELLDSDMLVVNIPPGLRRGETDYMANLNALKSVIGDKQYQRVIFISTSGVYPNEDNMMTEQDAASHNSVSDVLLQAESLFSCMSNACIVRFSGLVGPKRHPGRFLAGKDNVSGGNAAVNLVHLDDCVAAVSLILNSATVGAVYNLCAPDHPTKHAFYTQAALHAGMSVPTFNQQIAPSKVIDGNLICQQLGFTYQQPYLLKMLDAC